MRAVARLLGLAADAMRTLDNTFKAMSLKDLEAGWPWRPFTISRLRRGRTSGSTWEGGSYRSWAKMLSASPLEVEGSALLVGGHSERQRGHMPHGST